jgi:hypothetical protein
MLGMTSLAFRRPAAVAVPAVASGITADWLRRAAPGARDVAGVTCVRAERMAEGVGMLTDIHRLSLGYGAGVPRGPATLVAKLPSSIPQVRDLCKAYGFYEREVMFYRELARTIAVKSPRCLVAEFDPTTSAFVLVMEDLVGATMGDQVAGLGLGQVKAAIDQAAALHGRWWDHPQLRAVEGKVQPFGAPPWCGMAARHASGWETVDAWLDGRASRELRRIGERMCSTLDGIFRDASAGPRTICHGDFRADNLMFTGAADAPGLTCVDWQLVVQAAGPYDIGYMMSGSVNPDIRRDHEMALLRDYHADLEAAGVEGYGFDRCLHDYRRALLIGLTYLSQSGAACDLTHPRTEALYEAWAMRLDSAVHDLALAEFVD